MGQEGMEKNIRNSLPGETSEIIKALTGKKNPEARRADSTGVFDIPLAPYAGYGIGLLYGEFMEECTVCGILPVKLIFLF